MGSVVLQGPAHHPTQIAVVVDRAVIQGPALYKPIQGLLQMSTSFTYEHTTVLLTRAPPIVFELLWKSLWRRAGFEPTEIESCNL